MSAAVPTRRRFRSMATARSWGRHHVAHYTSKGHLPTALSFIFRSLPHPLTPWDPPDPHPQPQASFSPSQARGHGPWTPPYPSTSSATPSHSELLQAQPPYRSSRCRPRRLLAGGWVVLAPSLLRPAPEWAQSWHTGHVGVMRANPAAAFLRAAAIAGKRELL